MYTKPEALGSKEETFRRIGLAITDPSNPDAYSTSCHSVTAKNIRERGDQIPDDARIILFGYSNINRITHSIIVSKDDEVISDSLSATGIRATFDTATGSYSHPNFDGRSMFDGYEVMADMTLGEFRQTYMVQPVDEPPPPGG